MRNLLLITPALLMFVAVSQAADVSVNVNLSPAGSFQAKTERVTGTAYKTADGVAAENVVVDVKSLKTGVGLRDTHLLRRLEADKYPVVKLLRATGKNGQGQATIQIKNKTQQAQGTYKIEGNTLKAQFKIHLPDLDIKDVRYMGIGVDDDVVVSVDLPLTAGRATASVPHR